MIQRKQTIWLLLAAIAGFLITQLPLYIASLSGEIMKKFMATESLLLFAVAVIASLLGLITIFLFKNRSLQMKLSFLGLVISIAFIALQIWKMDEFREMNAPLKVSYYWGALLPIVMAFFFFLAIRNIRKDEKLVKSIDRLR